MTRSKAPAGPAALPPAARIAQRADGLATVELFPIPADTTHPWRVVVRKARYRGGRLEVAVITMTDDERAVTEFERQAALHCPPPPVPSKRRSGATRSAKPKPAATKPAATPRRGK